MKITFLTLTIATTLALLGYFFLINTLTPQASIELNSAANEEKLSKQQRIAEAFELEFLMTVDPATNTVPRERLLKAKAYTEDLLRRKNAIPGIEWEERGPDNVGGRTRAIIFDAADPTNNTVWAAGVSGGIWKSTNFLSDPPTWNPVNDFFDNIAVTVILQDPADPQILYFGTGEGWFNSSATRGLGIWKSSDGGTTWIQLSSTNNSTFYYVQDLIIDTNGNLYAATREGLQRSEDGGATWTQIMTGRFADLELGADDDIYATEGIFSLGSVWKSDAVTHGMNLGESGNWIDITPMGSFERIELATAPTDANRVYLLCQGEDDRDVTDMFRSDNASGNASPTWTSLPVPRIIDQGSNSIFTRNQGWYNLIATVDPNNADIVYIGGIDALRSTDAGANWTQITTWSLLNAPTYTDTQNVHADHHMITFAPGSSTDAIWGTDGGLDWTIDANNTTDFPSWISKNDGYNVTQYYACATVNESGSDYFIAGAQDNGTQQQTSAGISSAVQISGGDGGFCHIDEDNSNIQIASSQFNFFKITNDAWVTSKTNRILLGTFTSISDYDSKFNILYAASSTTEFGRMTDVGNTNIVSRVPLTDIDEYISAVTVSPNIDNRVYFGLRSGRILKVDDADTPSPISTIITPTQDSIYCSSIAVEKGNDDHLLATYSNYGVTSVYESMDGGVNWVVVEGNLPDIPIRWVIFNPNNSDQALVATEMGVWSTDNLNGSSTDWTPTNSMLANVRVNMLRVRPIDHAIVAATHGRGLFTSYDLSVARIQFIDDNTQTTETSSQTTCPDYTDITIPIGGLAEALAANAKIDVSVDGGSTATSGVDFELLNVPFTFTTSGGNRQDLVVRIYEDAVVENEETIILNINVKNSGVSDAVNGVRLQHTVTISDNDFPPTDIPSTTSEVGENSIFTFSSPFRGLYTDERYQTLVLASSLTAAGFVAGNIEELSFLVESKGSTQPYNNFTIKMGMTMTTSLDSLFLADASSIVYNDDYSTNFGWNTFVFDTPFAWDGTSNLIIETCFDNTSFTDDDYIATYDSGTYTETIYSRVDDSLGCNLTDVQLEGEAPYLRFKVGTPIKAESMLNASSEAYLAPLQTAYFYSETDGEIIAKIENLGFNDYGCTTITVDRAGTSATAQGGMETVSKTILINPTTNDPAGKYNITLYYSEAEISGFEMSSSTGDDRSSLQVAKSDGSISNASQLKLVPSTFTTIPSGDLAYTAAFRSGFSGFTLAGSTPLPVELLYFKGEIVKNQAVLNWETTSEINNEGFYLERSLDGISFETLDFIKGAGNSLANQQYAYTDHTIQIGQTYYYRLKQMDFDGKFEYSSVVALSTKETNGLSINLSPNPSAGQLNIAYNLPQTTSSRIDVIDPSGRLIQTLIDEKSVVGNYEFSSNLSHLEKGVYFILLTTEEKRLVKKFVLL